MALQQGLEYSYEIDDDLYGCVSLNSPSEIVQMLATFLQMKRCTVQSISPNTARKSDYQWVIRVLYDNKRAPKPAMLHEWLKGFEPQPASVLKAQIALLQKQVTELNTALAQQQNSTTAEPVQPSSSLDQHAALEAANTVLTQRVDSLQQALDGARSERDAAQGKAENAQRELASEQRKQNSYPERLDKLTAQNGQLQALLTDERQKNARMRAELDAADVLKMQIDQLKSQVKSLKDASAAEKKSAERRITEAQSKLVRLYDDLEEDKSFYLQQIDVLNDQLRGKRPKQMATGPDARDVSERIQAYRDQISDLETQLDTLREEKLKLYKRKTSVEDLLKRHEHDFLSLLEDLGIELGTTSDVNRRRVEAALSPQAGRKIARLHPRTFGEGIPALRQTIHSLRDKVTHLSQSRPDAPAMLDSISDGISTLSANDRLCVAFETLLPRVTFLRDSIDRIIDGVEESRWAIQAILEIAIGKSLSKAVAGAPGWNQVRYGTGQDNSGRIYYRIGKGGRKDHYDMLVSIKETQDPDIQYLKKQ
jgi:predicted  nucleic acid-binding Zn-ribbon protein